MSLPITWRPLAQDDLLELYAWIEEHADAATAFRYTAAIEEHVAKLGDLPGWGSPRDDLAPGIRTITYRRRTTIAYRELEGSIEIVRIAHGGRDLGRAFAETEE